MFGAPKRLGGYGWMDPGTRRKKNVTNHAHLRIGGFGFFPKKRHSIFGEMTCCFWGDLLVLGSLGSGFKYFYAYPYLGNRI